MTQESKPLTGLRVLVPRGGTWGDLVVQALRQQGANTVVAPMVDFAHTSEEDRLIEAFERLEAGYYDWITATSATVVDVLAHHEAKIPEHTRVAVVGEATHQAFVAAGYQVTRSPNKDDNTAEGLLRVWPEIDSGEVMRVLTLRSDVAKPVLTSGLIDRGHEVTQVVAFRTIGVPVSAHVKEDVASGRINALLVASVRIAREVATQFPRLPADTLVACVGPHTREETVATGLIHAQQSGMTEVEQALIRTVESAIDQSDMLD